MALVGQAVSEKKIFEIVDGRTDDGRPISSPCEPNGSGELKILLLVLFQMCVLNMYCICRIKNFENVFIRRGDRNAEQILRTTGRWDTVSVLK